MHGKENKKLSLPITKHVTLEAELVNKLEDSLYLYRVANYKELHQDKEAQKEISAWIHKADIAEIAKEKKAISLRKQRASMYDEFSEMNYL